MQVVLSRKAVLKPVFGICYWGQRPNLRIALELRGPIMYTDRAMIGVISVGFICEVTGAMNFDANNTITFSLDQERDALIKKTLTGVYDSLKEKGYNPINQIVGYILSEDPTYITNHNNARTLIRKIDRDELLQLLVKSYLDN